MLRRSVLLALLLSAPACKRGAVPPPADWGATPTTPDADASPDTAGKPPSETGVVADQFADLKVLRYEVPGFAGLEPKQKELLYYLYEAALSGRDLIWAQNYRYNLAVRRTLEAILRGWSGAREGEDWDAFVEYAKRVWFSNGIHHHYSMKKIIPGFSKKYFETLVRDLDHRALPLMEGDTVDAFLARMGPVMFDPNVDGKRVVLDPKVDMIAASATNYYGPNVTQKDVERYYGAVIDKSDQRPISHGLNSQLVKDGGELRERTWKVGGLYSPAIEQIVAWLTRAKAVAENPKQAKVIDTLIKYYQTGNLRIFDAYSVAWVGDTESRIDFVNGFIEVYGDPLGYRGAFESVVSIKDLEATKRIAAISKEAQWFEDHSTIPPETKKKNVTGISAKVITVVVEAGDASPSTPIGINLPNANWIRKEHGSKSVNLGNIVHAYEIASGSSGVLEEFAFSQQEVARAKEHNARADTLHTDMHEVIGHASGAINPGVGTPKETLKNYASTLEEARADLVALYFLLDPKLVDMGVMSTLDVGRAAYDDYMRNGLLVQLSRLERGEDLEEAHMRNRQMIAKWVYEKGKADKVVERVDRDGKTYFVVRDYDGLRRLFGELLAEVQRIKSTGDYEAGRALVETYGVKVDRELHEQVLSRYEALEVAPYSGFINPRLVPVEEDGEITDVRVEYPDNFVVQMLEYGDKYSLLPTYDFDAEGKPLDHKSPTANTATSGSGTDAGAASGAGAGAASR